MTKAPEFSKITFQEWRASVERSLEQRSFEEALCSRLPGGLVVQPLYHSMPQERGGSLPFGPAHGPTISSRIDAGTIKMVTEQVAQDAAGGADVGHVVLDQATRYSRSPLKSPGFVCADGASLYTAEELGVLLRAASKTFPLSFEVGLNGLAFAALLAALPAAERGMVGDVWHDPLAALPDPEGFPGTSAALFDETFLYFKQAHALLPTSGLLVIDACVVHEAGGSAPQELAYVLAHALQLLREGEHRGVTLESIVPRLRCAVSVGPDFFLEVAKLRALRLLWANLMQPLMPSASLHVTAVTARWNRMRDDPHTNLLRSTSEAVSVFVGGADAVQVEPFLFRGDGEEALARRLSRNVAHIVRHEALLGSVRDAGGGSYYVETLSQEVAQAAWEIFQSIEAKGGLVAVLSAGTFQADVACIRSERIAAIREGKEVLVGANAFRNNQELPRLMAYDIAEERSNRLEVWEKLSSAHVITKDEGKDFSGLSKAASRGVPLLLLSEAWRDRVSGGSLPAWTPTPLPPYCAQLEIDSLTGVSCHGGTL